MMLLEDVFIIENLEVLNEGTTGGPMKIKGCFQRADEANNNKRIYRRPLLEREITKLSDAMTERRLLGELDHPQHDSVRLSNVSHLITGLVMEGNEVIGCAEILDTPAGKVAKALIKGGVKIGISSRGMGTVTEELDGKRYVNEDFRLITWDIVADPSTRGAYPGLTESTLIQDIIDTVYPEAQKVKNFTTLLKEELIFETKKKSSKKKSSKRSPHGHPYPGVSNIRDDYLRSFANSKRQEGKLIVNDEGHTNLHHLVHNEGHGPRVFGRPVHPNLEWHLRQQANAHKGRTEGALRPHHQDTAVGKWEQDQRDKNPEEYTDTVGPVDAGGIRIGKTSQSRPRNDSTQLVNFMRDKLMEALGKKSMPAQERKGRKGLGQHQKTVPKTGSLPARRRGGKKPTVMHRKIGGKPAGSRIFQPGGREHGQHVFPSMADSTQFVNFMRDRLNEVSRALARRAALDHNEWYKEKKRAKLSSASRAELDRRIAARKKAEGQEYDTPQQHSSTQLVNFMRDKLMETRVRSIKKHPKEFIRQHKAAVASGKPIKFKLGPKKPTR